MQGEAHALPNFAAMGRVIGIDHGAKRTGLATTDPLGIIASALDTLPTGAVIDHLQRLHRAEPIEGFVVGLPVDLKGRPTDGTAGALAFMERLRQAFPGLWVEAVDERFTSTLAQHALRASGIGRQARRGAAALDRISATILLQGWIDQRSRTA